MHWTENGRQWEAVVVAVVVVVAAARTPPGTSAQAPAPSSNSYGVFTIDQHNYTLPLLLVRQRVFSSASPAISASSFDGVDEEVDEKWSSVERKEQISEPFPSKHEVDEKVDEKWLSVERKEQISESFPPKHKEERDHAFIPLTSDAPPSQITLEEASDTLHANRSDSPRPNAELLHYFRQLIEDINSAPKTAPDTYEIPPAAKGDVERDSNTSDTQQSAPTHYLLESESAPQTLLYSFPRDSVLREIAECNASSESKPSRDQTPDEATSKPDEDLTSTFESPKSEEEGLTSPPEHNTTHHDSLPSPHHLRNANHSRPMLEGEEILESAASQAGKVYYAQLPRPSLKEDKLPDSLYQYEVPETVPHYAFEYVVRDPLHGGLHGHSETRQGQDTHGRYFVLLPDGRLQTVTYIANERGYFPQVVYTGDAKPAVAIEPPEDLHKPFHQTLKPYYVKDKLVMPQAVLFKPKSAYLIKYNKPFPIHPPSAHGISLKPNYVTPATVQPLLKPTHPPTPLPLPPPVLTPRPIVPPIPIFPPPITTVPVPTLAPIPYSSTTLAPKPSPHPLHPTLGPVVSPQPHIINKSQHTPFPQPSTITTRRPKSSHFFPSITTVTPQPFPRPPEFPSTSHPLSPFLPTLTTTSRPFRNIHTLKPRFPTRPHVTHSQAKNPSRSKSSSSFSTTAVNSDFSPSRPAGVNSLTPAHSLPPPHLTTLPPPSHRPALIATSLPKYSPRYPFLTTHAPINAPLPSVITSPGPSHPSLHPHPRSHLTASPQPTPFSPTIITTSTSTQRPTPRPPPSPLHPFHPDHHSHHLKEHSFRNPFSPRPNQVPFDGHSSETPRPSLTTTTITTAVTSLPQPEPPHVHRILDTTGPRRLAPTPISSGHKPTLKPKPVYTPKEESPPESLHSFDHNSKSIFVTTLPGSEEEEYRFPKSSDVIQQSILGTLRPGDLKHLSEVFVSTPATYSSSSKYHISGREEAATTTSGVHTHTLSPLFTTVPDAKLTTIPNHIETHDSPYEAPFSPSKPISIDYTPRRPPPMSHPLTPSYHSDMNKYSIGIKVKPHTPPAFPSHGTLFRTAPSPPHTPLPYSQTHLHSQLDKELNRIQARDSISYTPASYVNPYLESFLPRSDMHIRPWSHLPYSLSLMSKKPPHEPLFDAHTTASSSPHLHHHTQLESWKPLAGPVSFPSMYNTPSPSSLLIH